MPFESLTVSQALILIREQTPIVLDLRDPHSFERGHLPGARRLSDELIHELIRTGKRRHPLLLYCYRGHSSKEMAQLLAGMGFSQIHELDEGWQGWLRHHDPIAQALSPLLEGASLGDIATVQVCLARGDSPHATTPDGNGAIWLACVGGRSEVVWALIAAGADPDHPNNEGNTALMYAASAGKSEMVALLLEVGADPHRRNMDDTTALELAACIGSLRALRRAMNPDRP